MALKRGGFAGLGKRQGKSACWAGNQHVRERSLVSEMQACGGGWGSTGSRRKPGHQGSGWWVPKQGIFCVLIWAVCKYLHGPMENPNLLSCDAGFLQSYTSNTTPFQGHLNSCSCLLLVHSVAMWEPSSFTPSHGEQMGTEVHYSISLLLPMLSKLSSQAIMYVCVRDGPNQPLHRDLQWSITRLPTCFHTGILLSLFNPEDGGDIFLWNVSWLSTYTALYPSCENLKSYLCGNTINQFQVCQHDVPQNERTPHSLSYLFQ
jgi:hypothetical protein